MKTNDFKRNEKNLNNVQIFLCPVDNNLSIEIRSGISLNVNHFYVNYNCTMKVKSMMRRYPRNKITINRT